MEYMNYSGLIKEANKMAAWRAPSRPKGIAQSFATQTKLSPSLAESAKKAGKDRMMRLAAKKKAGMAQAAVKASTAGSRGLLSRVHRKGRILAQKGLRRIFR